MGPPLKFNLLSKPALAGAAAKARKGASFYTPSGAATRAQGGKLPNTPDVDLEKLSGPKRRIPPREDSDLSIRKLTSFGPLLEALGNSKTYRAWNLGQGALVRAIRQMSDEMGTNVPQRFGCATAGELASKLVTLFKTQGMAEKLRQIKTESAKEMKRKLPGRERHYGGYFWEDIAKMDEHLGRVLTRLAGERLKRAKTERRMFSVSTSRGRLRQTPVPLSPGATFSEPLRSMDVVVKRAGNDKELKSADDLQVSVVTDKGVTYLAILVRAQYKREKAAESLGKQSDRDVRRWASDEMEALILKDLLDGNGKPLSFPRERILFIEDSFSRPTGIVQDSRVNGVGKVEVTTFKTDSGAQVTRYSMPVDTRLHDRLISATLSGLPLPR